MDRVRVDQILRAQEAFERRDALARALAERGVYVFGPLNIPVQPYDADDDRASLTPNRNGRQAQ